MLLRTHLPLVPLVRLPKRSVLINGPYTHNNNKSNNNASQQYQARSTMASINAMLLSGGSSRSSRTGSDIKMFSTKLDEIAVVPKFSSTTQNNNKNSKSSSTHECSKSIEAEYEEAITALNTLQSNADTIRRSIALNNKQTPLDDMYTCLKRSGLTLDEVEQLSFIHVSGTKGKGTTCALIESILRAHGLKTGFYSSPHLVSVTERIRINGAPIGKREFVEAFWSVYRRLEATKSTPLDMPAYFKFLTILSFHIFRAHQVDVVILEVGIGGELDCTNVIRNTKTVGITSLGLEHTQLLGDTLAEIAWQKAGIIKFNSDVYTNVTQPVCLEVLRRRASERQATVHEVPPLATYRSTSDDAQVDALLDGLNSVTRLNGSLAIQLANDWLRKQRPELLSTAPLSARVLAGLDACRWPGRCQVLQVQQMHIHLDGAHTLESMNVCSDWFCAATSSSGRPKVLIFNTTGDRDSNKLLDILRRPTHFDYACFVPNISSSRGANRHDIQSVYGIAEQIKRAKLHAGNWHALCQEDDIPDNSQTYGSIVEALNAVRQRYATPPQQVDVLVTGSLHLIGATLLALEELT